MVEYRLDHKYQPDEFKTEKVQREYYKCPGCNLRNTVINPWTCPNCGCDCSMCDYSATPPELWSLPPGALRMTD